MEEMEEADFAVLCDVVLGDRLSEYLYLLTGSTPSHVCKKHINTISELSYVDAAKLIDAAVLACAHHRKIVEDHLSRSENEAIRAYILKNFSVGNGKMNFTEVNLLGHCFLTGGVASTGTVIPQVRRRIGGDHVWNFDSGKCKLSQKQREITAEKTLRFSFEEANLHGRNALSAIEGRRTAAAAVQVQPNS